MHPTYFETLFVFGAASVASAAPHPAPLPGGERGPLVASGAPHADSLPTRFAIVTAYATTGEAWTGEENDAANARLQRELESLGVWMRAVTGYSPATGHAEPGWAVAIALDEACDLGLRFRQDAIYYVIEDALYVSHCDGRRGLVPVGAFRERLMPARDGSRQ